MTISLQELMSFLPLHKLYFYTSLPKKLIYYEAVKVHLPQGLLREGTLCVLTEAEEIDELNNWEHALQIIQDPNLVGIIISCQEPVYIQGEVCSLLQQFRLPLMQIYEENIEHLFQETNIEFSPYIELNEDLEGYTKRGFFNMASEIMKVLDTPLLYLEKHFQITWESGQPQTLRDAKRWLNTNIRELSKLQELEHSYEKQMLIARLDDSFKPYYIHIDEVEDKWIIVSNHLVDWQKRLMEKFIGLTSIYLKSKNQEETIHENMKEHFVNDLLYEKIESKSLIILQGSTFGWDLEKPHHLIVVDISPREICNKCPKWVSHIIQYIENIMRKINEIVHVFPFENQVVLLLEDARKLSDRNRKIYVNELSEYLVEHLIQKEPTFDFHIGIGKWYRDIKSLSKSYQEAQLALQWSQYWYTNKKVFHVEELGLVNLLVQVDRETLLNYCNYYIKPLMKMTMESKTDYIKTLKIYVQYHGKINEVSEALFVHPNTLRNHIRRIEETMKIDLQDAEEFTNLFLAIRIYEFLISLENPSANEIIDASLEENKYIVI